MLSRQSKRGSTIHTCLQGLIAYSYLSCEGRHALLRHFIRDKKNVNNGSML